MGPLTFIVPDRLYMYLFLTAVKRFFTFIQICDLGSLKTPSLEDTALTHAASPVSNLDVLLLYRCAPIYCGHPKISLSSEQKI